MTAYIMDSGLKLGDKGYLEEPLTDCAVYNRATDQAEKSKQYTKLLTPHTLYFQKKTSNDYMGLKDLTKIITNDIIAITI